MCIDAPFCRELLARTLEASNTITADIGIAHSETANRAMKAFFALCAKTYDSDLRRTGFHIWILTLLSRTIRASQASEVLAVLKLNEQERAGGFLR